ncbi:sensor histidine kinase [Nocardia jinanensis]|uniref:histidine kinase n=1 Tax=Nocardia jinanensis TaxID=382504 RepID=A0A917RH97_9NOCA|nr:ATP-binding protein [Nocardia jinanensis]GGL07680.1 histidine kinase [Nocardia jinanensis]
MYESVPVASAGGMGRRQLLAPALALGISVTVGIGLLAAAIMSVAPADRMITAVWVAVAVVAACTAIATAVYFRGQITAEQRRGAEALDRLAHTERRAAAAEQAVAAEKEISASSERRRSAAIAALANAAGRMQAMTTSMLANLQDLEHRYADQAVLTDLLKMDHATAQAGRLADSIAILSGARTGRRWAKPIVMERILRAAIGRVGGYQRVRLRAIVDIAIAGHAAEGVIHALSELVDNACRFSPPTTEVHIYAAEIPAGLVVTIEDSGLVMSESSLHRAQLTVSGAEGDAAEGLSSLNGTRFGLAVVGRLARKHGLTVSYRPSAIGGTAAVVMIPRELTARIEPPATPALPTGHSAGQAVLPPGAGDAADSGPFAVVSETGARFRAAPVDTAAADSSRTRYGAANTAPAGHVPGRHSSAQHRSGEFPAVAATEPEATTTTVLPKRRRGSTLAAAHPAGLPDPTSFDGAAGHDSSAKHRTSASSLGAFQRAVTGRADDEAQPFGGPIHPPGNGAARVSRHSMTTDRENDR